MTFEPYLSRTLEGAVLESAGEFPAVVLTGPRQSGKTTLLKYLFGDSYGYVSLELPDVRAAALADPRGFLEAYPPPVIFDEIQFASELLPYVKERIDADRRRTGQYLLSGSQNLLLVEKVTESLAGRAAIQRLLPLSRHEAAGHPLEIAPWLEPTSIGRGANEDGPHGGQASEEVEAPTADGRPSFEALWQSFLRGGYPELVTMPGRNFHRWHASYIQTYLERDIRTLRQVGDLTQFQNFLRALAARSGQLLNLSDVSRDLGIAVNTAKAWLSVLEASYQVTVVRPYFANIGKRLVKTPKIFLSDVGTLCHLAGLRDADHAAKGPLAGAILETAVLNQLLRTLVHRGEEPRVYFWRTAVGAEVDFLVELEGRIIPIEVKASATPNPRMAKGIHNLREDLGQKVTDGWLIHPGDVRLPLGDRVTALPFARL